MKLPGQGGGAKPFGTMDWSVLQGRRIGLGVGGGIAAYKAAELVRALQRSGAQVRVAMTPAATEFVGPLTFQALSGHPVLTNILDRSQEAAFGHIEFARWAELFVIAPATADLLARIVAGMGNDALAATLLAYRGKVLLAPAMNTAMWEHEATQRNLARAGEGRALPVRRSRLGAPGLRRGRIGAAERAGADRGRRGRAPR